MCASDSDRLPSGNAALVHRPGRPDVGGVEGGDQRHYRHLYDAKMNISTSFNPQNLRCDVCTTSHLLLERDGNPLPICFVASDQCFPACLPAGAGGRCCAIIRVEYRGLREIMTATRTILGGKKLPVGSTILLCSASHLSRVRVGTAKYASDLVDSFRVIEADYGNSVRAVHGFPVFTTGVEAGLGIRSFQKNVLFFAFFCVLYKRTFRSFRSFPFFIKERSVLSVLFCSL